MSIQHAQSCSHIELSYKPTDEVTLDVEGRPVAARVGDTLAAALWVAGITGLRETARGDTRGLFCGMGVCNECLVSVDGRESQRACMTKVTGPHIVRRQGFPVRLPQSATGTAPILASDLAVRTPDLLVIGGGAGGLSAAAVAAEAGLSVVLIDERARLGGQFFKQPGEAHRFATAIAADEQVAEGRKRIDRAQRAGVEIVSGADAWGVFAPLTIGVTTAAQSLLFRPRHLVVATGAYERGVPVPGWTLPGVMTSGAAQTLLKTDGVLPGRRVLVCGNGPLNLQVALELARAGTTIVAIAELAERPGLAKAGPLLRLMSSAIDLAWQGAAMLGELRRRGIPLLYGQGLKRVDRSGDALTALVGQRRFEVDAVLMGYGFMPSNELLRALGCRHDFDTARGHLVTQRNEDCETSMAGVYAVGDCCGLLGARAAADEGVIAGASVASALGRTVDPRLVANARRALVQHMRFQKALWQVFAAPRLQTERAEPATIVCRCEEVTLGAIEAALGDSVPTIGEVKRRTRLGMGRCQGRYCAPVLASLLAERQGRPVDELAFFAPRVPARPVSINDLVRAGSSSSPQSL
jgi:NADPH-dependent 2,4-dienoyl-CoA reductase/sulfur reductase-like enzyme